MINNKLQQLTKAIQEAVPEIMELKKGCRIKTVFGEFVDIVKDEKMPDGEIMINSSDYNYQYINVAEILEVIGRDITLEDCLISLNNNKALQYLVEQQADSDEECFLFSVFVFTLNPELPKNYIGELEWISNKSLSNQSEEDIDFLWDLICKV